MAFTLPDYYPGPHPVTPILGLGLWGMDEAVAIDFIKIDEAFGSSVGTVTDFSSGNLSPLFTTSVATPTTTPVLSFSLSSAAQNTVFAGPATGGTGAPSYRLLVPADIPPLPYIPSSTALPQTFAQIPGDLLASYSATTGLFTATFPQVLGIDSVAFNPTPAVGTVFTITAASGNGTNVTIVANNTLVPGQLVLLNGMAEAYLNGIIAQVLSTGLSNLQFEITNTATFSNASDTGTATVFLAPQAAIPAIWVVDANGNYNPQAGMDYTSVGAVWQANFPYGTTDTITDPNGYNQLVTASTGNSGATIPTFSDVLGATTTDNAITWTNVGYAGTQGTLCWYRRMFFRDGGQATQPGKNAFISMNHLAGVGVNNAVQDRTLWLSMQNSPNDNALHDSMAGIQVEVDVLGSPQIVPGPDGEFTAGSFQLSDQHTGAGLAAPDLGCNAIRAQYYREVGSDYWSGPTPCAGRFLAWNYSANNGGGQGLIGVYAQADDTTGSASNLYGVGIHIQNPSNRLPDGNIGLFIGPYSSNVEDFAIESQGAGQCWFGGPVGAASMFPTGTTGNIAVSGSMSLYGGLQVTSLSAPATISSVTPIGTTGFTTYTYYIVARDVNGNGVASAAGRTITNGYATLSATNFNFIEVVTAPIGPVTYDIYRTVGGATQGKITTIDPGPAMDYTEYGDFIYEDKGAVGDGTSPPSGNATGSITASSAITGGTLCVANGSNIVVIQNLGGGAYNFNLPATAGTAGYVLTSQGGGSSSMTWTAAGGGSGTVTSFSSGNIGTIITTSVASATTTPALSFSIATQNANIVWAGPTSGSAAAPTFRALVTADMPAGTGTVTTFSSGNLSPLFTTSVSTASTTPALSFSLSNAAQNEVFAGPSSGGTGAPSFRALVSADIPSLNYIPTTIMTTLGDILYENVTPTAARLAGNTTSTKNFLTQTGNGSVSAAPAWGTIALTDLPTGYNAWSNLTAASAGLTLANATYATTFNQTSAVNWTWANTTPTVTGAATTVALSTVTAPVNSSGNVWVYTLAATESGAGSNAWAGASVTISGYTGGATGNNGTFTLTASSTTTVTLTNASGTTTNTGSTPVMISSAVVDSPIYNLSGTINSGTAGTLNSIADTWTMQTVIGSVVPNPTSTLNIAHTGSTGKAYVSMPLGGGSANKYPGVIFNNDTTAGFGGYGTGSLSTYLGSTDFLQFYMNGTLTAALGMANGGFGAGSAFSFVAQTTNQGLYIGSNSSAQSAYTTNLAICVQLGASSGVAFQGTTSSGTQTSVNTIGTFSPASGTTAFRALSVTPTIAQTSTASGSYTGLYLGVTETGVLGTANMMIDCYGGSSAATHVFGVTNKGVISQYKGATTVKAGVGSIVAASLLTAQSAAITATTILATSTTPGAGMYRVSYVANVTTAASVSSALGGTAGFTITFTNANGDTASKTSNPTTAIISAGNTTSTSISGDLYCYAGASTNVQYAFGYTSSGTTAMVYDLAIYVEYLG